MTKNASLKCFRHILKYANWSLEFSSPFLKAGVVFAIFNQDGELNFSTESLKLERRAPANISTLSLIIFVTTSISWNVLEVYSFKIFLGISSLFTFEKKNDNLWRLLHISPIAKTLGWFLNTSPIARMLGWFLHFITHFKTVSLISLARGSQFKYSAILWL